MTEEKIIDTGKQADQQDKFADELLSEDELDNVAGGTTGKYKPDSIVLFYESEPAPNQPHGTSGK